MKTIYSILLAAMFATMFATAAQADTIQRKAADSIKADYFSSPITADEWKARKHAPTCNTEAPAWYENVPMLQAYIDGGSVTPYADYIGDWNLFVAEFNLCTSIYQAEPNTNNLP